MTVYLLDVNLLLALSDPMHVHHELAHRWFGATGRQAWATCPITENGFTRIASHPRYPHRPGDAAAVLAILDAMCKVDGHEFWPGDATLRDILAPATVVTHAHVTDVYLLGLAMRHGGMLATLDRKIPVAAVPGGENSLELVAA